MEELNNSEQTNSMLFKENVIDQATNIEAYNNYNLPVTWWEKFKASADEATIQQMKRNAFAFADNFLEAADTFGRNGIDDPILYSGMEKSIGRLQTKKPTEEQYKAGTTIRTAKELNEKYNTNEFQFDMDEALAPYYLSNRSAYKENAYISQKDGGSLSAELLGGIAGFAEPTNLGPSILVNSFMKGTKIASKAVGIVGTNLVESAASEVAQQYTRAIGAGVEASVGEGLMNTAIGTGLGSAIGLATRKFEVPTEPTKQEAVKVGNKGNEPNAPKGDSEAIKVMVDENHPLNTEVKNVIETLHEKGAEVNTAKLMEDLTPRLKPELLEEFKRVVGEYDSENGTMHVYNEKDPITHFVNDASEIDGEALEGVRVYSTDPQEGFRVSYLDGENSVHMTPVSLDRVLNISALTPENINFPLKLKAEVGETVAQVLHKLPPEERIPAMRQLSEANKNKALQTSNALYDFHGNTDDNGTFKYILKESEVDPPAKTKEQVLSEAVPDKRYGSKEDLSAFEEFINASPEIKEKLTDIQSDIEENLKKLNEAATQGFLDDDVVESLKQMREDKAVFKTIQKVKEAFIICTRGNF